MGRLTALALGALIPTAALGSTSTLAPDLAPERVTYVGWDTVATEWMGTPTCTITATNGAGQLMEIVTLRDGTGLVTMRQPVAVDFAERIGKGGAVNMELEIDDLGAWILTSVVIARVEGESASMSITHRFDDADAMSAFLRDLAEGDTLWMQSNSDTPEQKAITGWLLDGMGVTIIETLPECLLDLQYHVRG